MPFASIRPGLTEVEVGDRVAYAGGPPGTYAGAKINAADRLVVVSDGISDQQAAAMMLRA